MSLFLSILGFILAGASGFVSGRAANIAMENGNPEIAWLVGAVWVTGLWLRVGQMQAREDE